MLVFCATVLVMKRSYENGSAADKIAQIHRDLATGAEKRSAHLVNLSVATLKYLLLHSESDDIRYGAAQTLLSLSPHKRKLDLLAGVLEPPVMDRKSADRPAVFSKRLKSIMDASPESAQRVLAALAEAESEAGIPANPSEIAANSHILKDKP